MDFGVEKEIDSASQGLEAHGVEPEEEDAFDLYGDIDMDLVSSKPIKAATKSASGGALAGGRSRLDGLHSTLRSDPLLGKESSSSTLQQASTPVDPSVHPSQSIAVNPPATIGLNRSRIASPTEKGGLPPQSQQPLYAEVTSGPSVASAAPKPAASAPLTSAALASEYMARHGLGSGGGQGMQPVARGAPHLGKELMQVYVGELNWWTRDEEIERALGEYGLVKELRLFEEKANGKFKGYCQAEFFDADAAKACKEKMHGRVFTGRPCVVTLASTARPRQVSEAVAGPGRVEHDGRGAGVRGEAGPGRGPVGSGGFSGPSTGGIRPHGHGREGAGRGGYPGRGMEFGGAGAQMWDPGYAGGGVGFGRDGWGKGPYSQWGGTGYGAGAQGWEMDGLHRGSYQDAQGWYEPGPPWGWVGPNSEKRKREVD